MDLVPQPQFASFGYEFATMVGAMAGYPPIVDPNLQAAMGAQKLAVSQCDSPLLRFNGAALLSPDNKTEMAERNRH